MNLKICAGAVPFVIFSKDSSLRANNVRFGPVIEKGRDLHSVVMEENNLSSSG